MSLKIHYSFIVYLLILFFCNLLQYYLIFFLAICIHEITHAIVGVGMGIKIKSTTISFSGLSLQFYDFQIKKIKKIIILFSGPIINLIIAIFTYTFWGEEQIFFILCNLTLFIFNMLPIYPLDGGKILLEIIKNKKIIEIIQKTFCIILVIICIYMYINFQTIQLVFIGIYLLGFASLQKYDKYFLKYD